jgi:hypothetical protein
MPLLTDLNHLYRLLVKGIPLGSYEYVSVIFPLAANTDTQIVHSLKPATVDAVDYEIVNKDRACDVYRDNSASRAPWGKDFIVLRCSVANAVVTLRLSTRR